MSSTCRFEDLPEDMRNKIAYHAIVMVIPPVDSSSLKPKEPPDLNAFFLPLIRDLQRFGPPLTNQQKALLPAGSVTADESGRLSDVQRYNMYSMPYRLHALILLPNSVCCARCHTEASNCLNGNIPYDLICSDLTCSHYNTRVI